MKSTMTAVGALLIGAAFTSPAIAQRGTYGAEAAQQTPASDQAAPAQTSGAIKTHAPKVSKEAGKPLQELQKAVNEKNTAAIPAAMAAAQAAVKTPADKYVLAIMQLKAAADAKDQAGVAAAIEAMLASGETAEDEKFSLYSHLGDAYAAANQNARAAQAYQQALQLNPNSIESTAGLAEALAAQGQAAQAMTLLQKGIALQSTGGAHAPEAWYKRALQIAYKNKLPQAIDVSREWVQAYPSSSSWVNALAVSQNLASLDDAQNLDLMRLKRAVKVLTPGDYFTYGQIALDKGYPGEAKLILDEGFAANAIKRSDPSFSQLYALASKKAEGDKASLAAAPAAGATGRQITSIGDAYYGYGDYAKAAEFYRAALAKSDADANVVNLHLGMALARQGDKAGAAAAFAKVGGANAALAKYWLIYAGAAA
jgi:tetratricopeptide (TPR) repeat protein